MISGRTRRRVSGWLATWLVLFGGACGRAESHTAEECLPGITELCTGVDGCSGARACNDEGTGFGACDCGSRPLSSDSGAGRVTADDVLAARCEVDADCGPNLRCWSADAEGLAGFVGGVAGGYCTTTCGVLEDCTRFDPAATCSKSDPAADGVCFRGCLSKDPEPGELKCLDRDDLICFSSAALGDEPFDPAQRQLGACAASCGSDADCSGRHCDPSSGRCVDSAATGAPVGAECASNAACAGQQCLIPVGGPRFCSAFCSLRSPTACNFGAPGSPRQAACTDVFVSNGSVGEGLRDLGVCRELCDIDADCVRPGWFCEPLAGLPRPGICDFTE